MPFYINPILPTARVFVLYCSRSSLFSLSLSLSLFSFPGRLSADFFSLASSGVPVASRGHLRAAWYLY